MTKIVYNACFGGFSLSHEGVRLYGKIKGIKLVFFPDERFKNHDWGTWYIDGIEDSEHHFSIYDFERDDPVLVQVVEELGDKANGEHAELRIAEVEEGQRYRIDEYDGRESVMTPFDYDWNIA